MSVTQPEERIRFARKDVDRLHEDVEDWKRRHDEVRDDCWIGEDLAAKANHLFGRILRLDTDLQERFLMGRIPYDAELADGVRRLFSDWLTACREIAPQVGRLAETYGDVEGGDELRRNIAEAEAMLTPDAEFFGDERLDELEEQALREHRSGLTEPWPDDEQRTP